jgi:hypothetical protein
MPKLLITLVLALAVAPVVQAKPKLDPDKCKKHDACVRAPEIDPGTALSGLTLLAGGLAVIRGRRTKK